MMVARIQNSRKARFLAALARCGMQQKDWIAKYGKGVNGKGISRTHLYLTLKDEKQSLRLARKIDAFVKEVDEKMKGVAA